jgi:N-acyl-phosphatidylethanolamine-hydrolysing phospholipase D
MNRHNDSGSSPYRKFHFKSTSAGTATLSRYFKMRLREGAFPPVDDAEVQSVLAQPDLKLLHSPAASPRATWIGHATMLVQYRGVGFLTDPHFTERPGPVNFGVPKRLTMPALSRAELPRIDFIVVSHNHYDHLDSGTVGMFGNDVLWYVPLGLKRWFCKRGIRPDRVVELDWWQSHRFGGDVAVTLAPSVHWSKRSPWDTDSSLWGSWSVNIAGFNCWFAGDTGYDDRMFREIGGRLGPFGLAFIPIGAYEPRYFMAPQHVDPLHAVKIHGDIGARYSIPMHWGTFRLTHEPFLEPPRLLARAMEDAGLPVEAFRPIKIGETVVLGD